MDGLGKIATVHEEQHRAPALRVPTPVVALTSDPDDWSKPRGNRVIIKEVRAPLTTGFARCLSREASQAVGATGETLTSPPRSAEPHLWAIT
ncbi:hypothetical protein QFZ75_002871 [Streptomyces sp. V3I8]|nr:hypothetical protein [Streptomyces sp. V3I8]